MTVGAAPAGTLICPWQPAGEVHEVVWVAVSWLNRHPHTQTEYFRCTACPRALRVTHGVIESTPGREVVVKL